MCYAQQCNAALSAAFSKDAVHTASRNQMGSRHSSSKSHTPQLCLIDHRTRRTCRGIWSSRLGTVIGWCFGWIVTGREKTLPMR